MIASECHYLQYRKIYIIGFTDFAYEVAEGSKSEIFRRCDIGASNENDSKYI